MRRLLRFSEFIAAKNELSRKLELVQAICQEDGILPDNFEDRLKSALTTPKPTKKRRRQVNVKALQIDLSGDKGEFPENLNEFSAEAYEARLHDMLTVASVLNERGRAGIYLKVRRIMNVLRKTRSGLARLKAIAGVN
jgi:hypothetical protein